MIYLSLFKNKRILSVKSETSSFLLDIFASANYKEVGLEIKLSKSESNYFMNCFEINSLNKF